VSATAIDIQDRLDRQARRKALLTAVLPYVGLVFITALLTITTEGKLLRSSNLPVILNGAFSVALASVGAAFVYAHGGIDFSIGASAGLAQYVAMVVLTHMGLPVYVAIPSCILVPIVASTLVGSVAVLLRVPSFVTSLGVRSICLGLLAAGVNSLSAGKNKIDFAQYSGFNNEFLKLGVLILVFAAGYFAFEKNIFGKGLKAIGGNPITAQQSGIRVNRNIILAYSALGLCVGIVAFFQLTRLGFVSASSGTGLEFDIMIALMLGGFPMSGGSTARLRAVLIGALTITILSNGLIIWGLDVSIVNGVKGLLFLAIVALSYDRSSVKQVNMMAT
jgi:ribose transport system permease protein